MPLLNLSGFLFYIRCFCLYTHFTMYLQYSIIVGLVLALEIGCVVMAIVYKSDVSTFTLLLLVCTLLVCSYMDVVQCVGPISELCTMS